MAEEKDREGTEVIVAEFHKKIKEAFEVFDHETNNTVDVREIGTIIRSLGCCPTEGELHDFIAEVHAVTLSSLKGVLVAHPLSSWPPLQLHRHPLSEEATSPTTATFQNTPVEEEEPTGYIRYEKFLPVMTRVLLERKYRPIAEDVLLRAFEVLDPARRGFLTKDELVKFMTEEGEPFSQEEMEEMLSAAIDPDSNSINYRDYITMMVIDEN